MKNKSVPAITGLLKIKSVILLFVLSPLTAAAFDPPPPGAGLCFGVGAGPYFSDVVSAVAGQELVLLNITEVVLPDNDMDGFQAVRSTVYVQVVDRDGNQLWRTPNLRLSSPDIATVVLGGGIAPDFYFLPGFFDNLFAAFLYFGNSLCYGTMHAIEDENGTRYLAVIAGFLAQTGADEASGVDESRVNVWVFDSETGALIHEHRIRSRANRYLAAVSISGVGPVDQSNGDDLIVTWAVPLGDGKYKLQTEIYDILDGSFLDKFISFIRNVRKF